MGKYLITGRQGSGKTTVIKYLRKIGYTAYNTDELPDVTKLQDKQTGKIVEWPNGKVDWSKFVLELARELHLNNYSISNDTVFIGAVASNQLDFYDLFDRVFVLTVSANTLRQQFEKHEHHTHKLPGEVERLVIDHENKQKLFITEGAEPISGERVTEEIVSYIFNRIGL